MSSHDMEVDRQGIKRKAESSGEADEKKPKSKQKPKMKPDVRRAVMTHVFDSKPVDDVSFPDEDAFDRELAAQRLRPLRLFFCCRSFTTVFCSESEKYLKDSAFSLTVEHYHCSFARGQRGPFRCFLKNAYLSFDSTKRILLLGRSAARKLNLSAIPSRVSSFQQLRNWAEVFSTFTKLPHLESITVWIGWSENSAWIALLLRDFLPLHLVDSFEGHGATFFVLGSPQVATERASLHDYSEAAELVPFFRARARMLRIAAYPQAITASGPYKRNEVVQKVILDVHATEVSVLNTRRLLPDPPVWCDEGTCKYRAAFQQLHALNDDFCLEILLANVNAARDASTDQWILQFDRWLQRSLKLAECAKEAGISSLQVRVTIGDYERNFPAEEHKRVMAAAERFFGQRANFTRQTADFDTELVDECEGSGSKVDYVWQLHVDTMKVWFEFVGAV